MQRNIINKLILNNILNQYPTNILNKLYSKMIQYFLPILHKNKNQNLLKNKSTL